LAFSGLKLFQQNIVFQQNIIGLRWDLSSKLPISRVIQIKSRQNTLATTIV